MKGKKNSPPEPPVSDSELNQVGQKFSEMYRTRLRNYAETNSVDTHDFVEKMLKRFVDAYHTNGNYCAHVREKGVEQAHKHSFWSNWCDWAKSDLWAEQFNQEMGWTTHAEGRFLRLADTRGNGRLFPLVGQYVSAEQRRLLGQLQKRDKKLCEVSAAENDGVWREDAQRGPLTLHLTNKGSGNGHGTVEKLVGLGFLRKCRTDDDLTCLWRYETVKDEDTGIEETDVPFTVELTRQGRALINGEISTFVNIDQRSKDADTESNIATSHANSPMEDAMDKMRRHHADLVSLALDFAQAKLLIPSTQIQIFRLYKLGEGQDDKPWTLQQLADQFGTSKTTIGRWVKDIDKALYNNVELQEYLTPILEALP